MSGRKGVLIQFPNIVNATMLTPVTSAVTNIQFLDNIGVQLDWTGLAVGTFQVQVSANYASDLLGQAVQNPGTWTPVTLTYLLAGVLTTANSIPTLAGSPIYIDLNQLSAPAMRVVYTPISGTGVLNGIVTAKEI